MLKNKKLFLFTVVILSIVLFIAVYAFYFVSYYFPSLSNLEHKSFLINADNQPVRLKAMHERFANENMNFERFSAITPKDVTLEYIDSTTGELKKITADRVSEIKEWNNVKVSCSNTNEFYINSKHWGTRDDSRVYPGQLGCWCSHRILWEKIVEDNLDYAIIFEDDVVLAKSFKSKLGLLIKSLPDDYEILVLHDHIAKVKRQFMVYLNPFLKRYNGRGFWGTEGYVVSKKGAKALLEITKISDRPVDNQMELLMQNGNTYLPRFSSLIPVEGQASEEGSTIIPVPKK